MSTRLTFSKAVLLGLGVNPNYQHVGARRALVAWMGPESGWTAPCDGVHGAAFNPLNTTLVLPSCTQAKPYNSIPVQNYDSFNCGVAATIATLRESRYDAFRAVLLKPFVTGRTVLRAVADTDWGTFHTSTGEPDYAGADAIYATYLRNRNVYNVVEIG